MDKFILYRGVIENNNSPLKDGRVQVRVYSIHPESKEEVKTEHLPWAEVLQSTAFGFNTGIGFTSIPNKGTWVYCILDHDNPNMPIIIGAISGKPAKKADTSLGFNDPDGVFPLEDRLNEEDQNRLQRVENLSKTIHQKINDTLDFVGTTDSVCGADARMREPVSLNGSSIYPNTAVMETKTGHVVEIDDTPNNERIRIYHRTGSYLEIRPDGTFVQKCTNTDSTSFYMHSSNVNEHIKKTVKRYIEENLNEVIEQSVQRNIKQNLIEHINGTKTTIVDGKVQDKFGADNIIEIAGNLVWKVGGTVTMYAGGDITLQAPNVHLNPGVGAPGIPDIPPVSFPPMVTIGAAEPSLTNKNVVYSQPLVETPSPKVQAQDETGAPVENAPGPEITGGETEELPPPESPATAPTCTNPYDVASASMGAGDWKENGANKNILALWEEIGQPKTNDRTAWCACFLSATLKRAKCKYKPTPSSQAYSSYGQAVSGWETESGWKSNVKKGDILVFSHGGGSGHVGFYNGDSGRYPKVGVLGGNQSDTLKVLYFECNKTSTPMKLIAVRRPLCEGGDPAVT